MIFETLAEAGPYRVLHLPGEGDSLVLSCASVGHDPTRAPSPEWARSTRPHPTLFLIDEARSWASAPGLGAALDQALTRLAARQPIARILALGASMGGFMALAVAELIEPEAVIAIGPQHQPAAPWERRWRAHTAALPPDLTAPFPRARQTYILHGMVDDLDQALPFRTRDHLLFADRGHADLALHLKPAMPGLIAAALEGDRRRFLRLIARAGGHRRPFPGPNP